VSEAPSSGPTDAELRAYVDTPEWWRGVGASLTVLAAAAEKVAKAIESGDPFAVVAASDQFADLSLHLTVTMAPIVRATTGLALP
jgi:pantothenate synthetase